MILVTGATGNVGSQVVDQLLTQQHPVRVFTRDAAKVARWGDRVEVALGDFTQAETFAAALKGVDSVFLMNGTLTPTVFRALLAAAQAQGRPRIVFLSTLFVSQSDLAIGQFHKDKEEALRDSDLSYAVVRAGGFMTNALQWIGSIRAEGIVYNAMGSGTIASIDPADIAAVAVHALTVPVLTETLYEVTGGELLTAEQKVAILSRVTGKPLRTVPIEPETAVEGMLRNGLPPQVAGAVAQSMAAIRDGRATQMTDTVRRITGRAPRTFEAWAQEHAAQFS
jgi:uncharacterized protein YbjT (DUF2867 family)